MRALILAGLLTSLTMPGLLHADTKVPLSASPVSGSAPLTVTFISSYGIDPSASDGAVNIEFGDGSAQRIICRENQHLCQAPVTIQHNYAHPGTYKAVLKTGGMCAALERVPPPPSPDVCMRTLAEITITVTKPVR